MHLTGNITDYFAAFAGGVLVSFSPCLYPVMPITASFIAGVNTRGTKLMGFLISLIYVLGIAAAYSTIAIVAALTGKIFGQFQNSPVVFLIVGNVLLFFALSLLDVIPLPMLGIDVQNKIRPTNMVMVLLLGAASGLIIGPCTAPILGSLLLHIASKQNILYGASLMFVFSYGLGASLILIGTFSGMLSRMPKSGSWLIRVKQFCGFILLLAAEYFFIQAGRLWL